VGRLLWRWKVFLPDPEPGQLLMRQSAASVNFLNIHVRSGKLQDVSYAGVGGRQYCGRRG